MYQCGSWRKIGDLICLDVFLASDRHCQTVATVCNLHVSRFKDDWCLLHPHITHRSSFRNRASFSQYISFDVVTWNTLNLWICLVVHACRTCAKCTCRTCLWRKSIFEKILLFRKNIIEISLGICRGLFSLFYGIVPYDAARINWLTPYRRERLLVLLFFFLIQPLCSGYRKNNFLIFLFSLFYTLLFLCLFCNEGAPVMGLMDWSLCCRASLSPLFMSSGHLRQSVFFPRYK